MRKKTCVTLDKPIAIGMCVLDLSKLLMYDYHYNTIKKQYKDRATLLFTDTDSLTYEIGTNDIYDDMKKDKQLYDFNDYPKVSTFHIGNSPTNDLFGNFLYYLKFNKNINIFAIIYKVEIGIQQCTIQRFTQTIQI